MFEPVPHFIRQPMTCPVHGPIGTLYSDVGFPNGTLSPEVVQICNACLRTVIEQHFPKLTFAESGEP